jgi:GNAT superfamily N-acetyltransferase
MVSALTFRLLGERDRCDDFTAGPGQEKLTEFFRRYAKQHKRRSSSATYIGENNGAIHGFVTIVPGIVKPEHLSGEVQGLAQSYDAPVLVLARMATDERFQRTGVGDRILREVVFNAAIALAQNYGCVGVYTDAKPGSVGFYAKYGFAEIPPRPADPHATTRMFLGLAAIRKLLAPAAK